MKRILVNDRCLFRGGTGVSMYLRNVLAHWPQDADFRPVGFCADCSKLWRKLIASPPASPGPSLVLRPLKDLGRPGRTPRSPSRWVRRGIQKLYSGSLTREFRRGGYCAYFEPNSLAIPCGGPTVTTLTDLSVYEYPQWHPLDRVAQWKANLGTSVATTNRWIVYSQFVKGRMVELLGVEPARITVAPLAARPLPYPDPAELARLAGAAALPIRYLLHLGTLEPRKNLGVLLNAWATLAPAERENYRLIFAGAPGWGMQEFWRSLVEHPMAGEVLMTGYISDASVALLVAGALAVLVPSRYEGFGLPQLEAMACGTPAICSTAKALQEVVADPTGMIDPDDTAGWAQAIRRAMTDEQWRLDSRRTGLARALEFSWDRTAQAHVEVFADLMK